MSLAVKIILAVVIGAILLGVLYSVLSSLLMYALLAGGALAAFALLWRWLAAGGGRKNAAFRLAAGADDKKAEKRAARELKQLEKEKARRPSGS